MITSRTFAPATLVALAVSACRRAPDSSVAWVDPNRLDLSGKAARPMVLETMRKPFGLMPALRRRLAILQRQDGNKVAMEIAQRSLTRRSPNAGFFAIDMAVPNFPRAIAQSQTVLVSYPYQPASADAAAAALFENAVTPGILPVKVAAYQSAAMTANVPK